MVHVSQLRFLWEFTQIYSIFNCNLQEVISLGFSQPRPSTAFARYGVRKLKSVGPAVGRGGRAAFRSSKGEHRDPGAGFRLFFFWQILGQAPFLQSNQPSTRSSEEHLYYLIAQVFRAKATWEETSWRILGDTHSLLFFLMYSLGGGNEARTRLPSVGPNRHVCHRQ